MVTTIFLSNNIIQAATGEKNKSKGRVDKVYKLAMPEGNMLNGMITNEEALIEQLEIFWNTNNLPRTNVELVINGLAFSIKKLEFPVSDRKKIKQMIPMEYGENDSSDNPIYDFVITEKKNKDSMTNIIAVRTAQVQIEKWIEIFKKINVTLEEITASNLTNYKYFKTKDELKTGSDIILVIDDNSLNSYLWVNGKQIYNTSKRFFSSKGTPEFGMEVTRQVSDIQQFYRSLKFDFPLTGIFTAGFDVDSIAELQNSLNDAGINLNVNRLSGEYNESAAVIGNFIRKDDDINLIRAYAKKKKSEKKKKLPLKAILGPSILFAVCFVISIVMLIISWTKNSKIKELKKYCENPQIIENARQVDEMTAEIGKYKKAFSQIETVDNIINSYPSLNSKLVDTVLSVDSDKVKATISAYEANSGVLSITAVMEDVNECNSYVRQLRNTGLFTEVDYTGYNQDTKTLMYNVTVKTILKEEAGK